MADIKSQVQSLNPNTQSRKLKQIIKPTGNIYESLVITSKRANTLTGEIREELKGKLEEFAIEHDSIEEIQENKEQIEISKFYEKLPNPAIIALNEFLDGELAWRYQDEDEE